MRAILSFAKTFIALTILCAASCVAQITDVTGDQSSTTPGGNALEMLNDSVNPGNGGLSVTISPAMPKGREMTIPFSFSYSSNAAHHFVAPNASPVLRQDNLSYLGVGGWSYDIPQLNVVQNFTQVKTSNSPPQYQPCTFYTNFVMTDMNGAAHSLNLSSGNYGQGYCPFNHLTGGDDLVQAVVGTGQSSYANMLPVTVADLHGTVYSFSGNNPIHNFSPSITAGQSVLPAWVETPNGNRATITDSGNGAFTITDSMGRTALTSTGFGQDGNQILISGFPAYTVHWGSASSNWPYHATAASGVTPDLCAGNGPGTLNLTLPEITSIEIPTGQYTFSYDPVSGLLTSITYPTGAIVSYTWGTYPLSDAINAYSDAHGNPDCQQIHDTQVVTKRVVFDGTRNVLEQDFSYNPMTWNGTAGGQAWTTRTTTVTTTDLVRNTSYNTVYTLQAFPLTSQWNNNVRSGAGIAPTVIQIQQYDSSGKLLQTINKSYTSIMLPPTETTTLDNGLVSKKQYTYAHSGGYPYVETDRSVYDYGAGAPGMLLHRVHTNYASFPATPIYPYAPSILDRPSQTITYDANNNIVAEKDYGYDNYAQNGQTGIVPITAAAHDDQNYGVNVTNRGNATSTTEHCLISGATCPQGNPTIDAAYDQTGQVISRKDALGNITTFSYTDSFDTPPAVQTNAYPTIITAPQTGSVQHIRTFKYAYSDGQRLTATDQNQIPTYYSYEPFLRRLNETDFFDGGATTTQYNDNAHPQTVVTKRKLNSATWITTTSTLDGMGRTVKTQTSDSQGPIEIDTGYNGLGDAYQHWNAYRSSSDSTYGVTTTVSDPLGRVTQMTMPDGGSVLTSYTGNQTTVSDEAGNIHRTMQNATGDVIEADEPGGNTGFPTRGYVSVNAVNGSGLQTTMAGSSPGTAASATIAISGQGQCVGVINPSCDYFTITMTVGSDTEKLYFSGLSLSGGLTTAQSVAQAFATAFTTDSTQVSAVASQVSDVYHWRITFTAKQVGTGSNGIAFSASETSFYPGQYPVDFTFSPTSGSLGGGVNPITGTPVTDYGTVTGSLNGASFTVCYGPNPSSSCNGVNNSTAAQVVSALLVPLQNSSVWNTSVTQSSAASSTFLMYTKANTAANNGTVTITSTTALPQYFSQGSFSGGGTLNGGLDPAPASINTPFVTLYSYDAMGNLLCVEQHGDAVGTGCASYPNPTANDPWRPRMYKYDSLGQLVSVSNPESGTTSHTYDANGNLLTKTDSRNQTVSYCYDALNRPTGRAYSAQACPLTTPVVTYAYDQGAYAIGQRTTMTDSGGSTNWTYDVVGHVHTEQRTTAGIANTTTYGYNLLGTVNSLTYPTGDLLTYGTDISGKLVSAVDSAHGINYVTGATYTAGGQVTGYTNGTGITNAFSYNPRLQLLGLSATAGSQTIVNFAYDFHLGNGDTGNVFQVTNNKDTSRSQAFGYDALNRLTSAQTVGTDCTATVPGNANQTIHWGNTYTYDAWGNLNAKNQTLCKPESFAGTANSNNQVPSQYGYDLAGNVTNGSAYQYDADGNLTNASGYTYVYDGDGNRVEKLGGVGTIYWYGRSGVLAETDLTGASQQENIYFNGNRVARNSSGTIYYLFGNHLHSTSIIADASGTILRESDYYPWGGEVPVVVTGVDDHYKFTAKERDETGFDYFGARHYMNWSGRFIKPDEPLEDQDPGKPQSWNLYTYGRNNPVSNFDPDGRACVVDEASGETYDDDRPGESCDEVDTANQDYHDDHQAAVTVEATYNQNERIQELSDDINEDTSTANLCAYGRQGIEDSMWADGAAEIPDALEGGWDLWKAWRAGRKMAGVRAAGEVGELAVGLAKNTEHIASVTGKSYRIPDILSKSEKIIGEIKNVAKQSLTKQLKDDLAYAATNGYSMKLYVNSKTVLTGPLQKLVDNGTITLIRVVMK